MSDAGGELIELSYSYTYGVEKPARQKILSLESALMAQEESISSDELTEQLVEHFFAPQVYGRKMFIPEGMCIVGKIHNHAHLNVITRGRIKVVTEFGDEILEWPKIWISEPGTKRAVYALTDTEWLTIHPNFSDTKDLEDLEEYVIAPDYD